MFATDIQGGMKLCFGGFGLGGTPKNPVSTNPFSYGGLGTGLNQASGTTLGNVQGGVLKQSAFGM